MDPKTHRSIKQTFDFTNCVFYLWDDICTRFKTHLVEEAVRRRKTDERSKEIEEAIKPRSR